MKVRYWATESVLWFMQNEKIEVILIVKLHFSAILNGALLLSTSLNLQEIHLFLCLTYISHRYLPQGSHCFYHRRLPTEIINRNWFQRFTEQLSGLLLFLLMVILANLIKDTSKKEMSVTLCLYQMGISRF